MVTTTLSFKKTVLVLFLFLATAVCLAGITIFAINNKQPSSSPSTTSKEEAIRQAKNYKPDGVCGEALTPARHTATGAEYTFPNTCLAPGWEALQTSP